MFEDFRVSGVALVRRRRAWNSSWVRLRASGVRLGGVLGPPWNVLGGPWKGFGES